MIGANCCRGKAWVLLEAKRPRVECVAQLPEAKGSETQEIGKSGEAR